ncbi:MAG: universal stress protein [Proteobacteria bacterium]|nr:universal stress protein [Pseudomonadota bacterium]
MSVKDILVHINVSKHCPARVETAAQLAKAFDARLTALYTSAVGDVPFFMMEEVGAKVEPTMRAWWLQMRDKVKAGFDRAMSKAGTAAEWIEVDDRDGSVVSHHARYADLVIVGQIDQDELLPRPEYAIPERVALESGAPTLVVPHAGTPAAVGRKILIAWNGSAQSARAVRDAFPFLARAERVTVLTINPDAHQSKFGPPGSRIAAHLSNHGIMADVRELTVAESAIGDTILAQAADSDSDLIVMGAYGHPRAYEVVLGGATRTLFRQMTVPILMSH